MKRFRKPVLALVIAVYFSVFFTSPAIAGMIGSIASSQKVDAQIRSEEISKIQRAMESRVVKEKMEAYGLQPEEIKAKLQSMSDDQIHMLSQASDRLLAGADSGAGFVIVLLVVIILVLVIVKLMGKTVTIK
ncbi:MAG TPA: PA2779 family protein [Syntrophales bacterium]|nr:PA2779 family protein [Syntrophales bacterium]